MHNRYRGHVAVVLSIRSASPEVAGTETFYLI
jgi:hypothetical protein